VSRPTIRRGRRACFVGHFVSEPMPPYRPFDIALHCREARGPFHNPARPRFNLAAKHHPENVVKACASPPDWRLVTTKAPASSRRHVEQSLRTLERAGLRKWRSGPFPSVCPSQVSICWPAHSEGVRFVSCPTIRRADRACHCFADLLLNRSSIAMAKTDSASSLP
jgi:hypothetical protein